MLNIVAARVKSDLEQAYVSFKLKPGITVRVVSEIGYYVKRLALPGKKGASNSGTKVKAVVKDESPGKSNAGGVTDLKKDTSTPEYFVVHSTSGNISDEALAEKKKQKKQGAAHAYISKKGEIVKIWQYADPKGWATKAEKRNPELKGQLVNIELVYADADGGPTEAQYNALADIYVETHEEFSLWLKIVSHREVDRGIKRGHSDPTGFDFPKFYKILGNRKVPISSIEKQSQARFNQAPWCEHEWVWPPVLEGLKFKKVSDEVYKSKGCG